MKKQVVFFTLAFFAVNSLTAQMTVSGILESTVSAGAGAADAPDFYYGMEQFANIRFQSRLRETGTVFGAVNLIAAAGSFANAMNAANSGGVVIGDNFVTAIEIERLFFRLSGESVNFEGGLFRLPFGYSQVWGSSDFLNPRNPLRPNARPRGTLGASLTWFPADSLRLLGFSAVPRDPFSHGEGFIAGISAEQHWRRISIQPLYAFEIPGDYSKYGIHRAGLSIKADVEIGVVIDFLYTYNHEAETRWDGLSFSAGVDYSFIDGRLLVMAEYLFNGAASSTSLNYGGNFTGEHYLYTGLTWLFDDFTNLSLALISNLDDASFTPLITFNREVFQGATLTIIAQAPLDRDLFNGDNIRGELTTRLRLRF